MPKETFTNLPQEKQEKVLRSAISEFLTKGFEKGNIGEIAKQAGVAKGSMYQYFDDKKELFLYAVSWSMELVMIKYRSIREMDTQNLTIFEYLFQSPRLMAKQLSEEQDLVVFLLDVFLGKFSSVADESLARVMVIADQFVLQLIQDGKNKGMIRKDIDDRILALYLTGASTKFKYDILNKVRSAESIVLDDQFLESYERELSSFLDLIINGMGVK